MIKTLNEIYIELRNKLKNDGRLQSDLEAREICIRGTCVERGDFDRAKNLYMSKASADAIYAAF